jgi:hypothetical protein
MTKLSITVLALVFGMAVALPQGFGGGNFGGGGFGGNFGGGSFGGTQEVDTFERLPGGGFIEDEKIIR